MNGIVFSVGVLVLTTIIMGVFFVIRGYYRFKEWRDGDKDELWNFLSFWVGGAAALLAGFTSAPLLGDLEAAGAFYAVMPTFMFIALGAIALKTIGLILTWRKMD